MELTEAIVEKLCSYIRLGVSLDVAAMSEGIFEETIQQWLDPSKSDQEPYKSFPNRIRQAQAQCEVLHIQRIVQSGSSRESQWILERMHPEKWSPQKVTTPKQRQKISAAIDAAFEEKPKRIIHDKRK